MGGWVYCFVHGRLRDFARKNSPNPAGLLVAVGWATLAHFFALMIYNRQAEVGVCWIVEGRGGEVFFCEITGARAESEE